ncbi:hypothetical protein D3C78_848760 [compost metagenome]
MNAHLGQFWQQRLDLVPDPFGDHFAGRVFQARNVVQVIVVQLFIQRLEDRLDLGKVADPAGMRVKRAGQMQADLERVAMQAAAFVPGRDVRQAVGRFEGKFLKDFHGQNSVCIEDARSLPAWSLQGLQAFVQPPGGDQLQQFVTQPLAFGNGLVPVAFAAGCIAHETLEVVAVGQLAEGQCGQVLR